jgi:hypothetical protein
VVDPLGKHVRIGRGRGNLEPNWQYLGSVHSDLPGAALVREEDDILEAFIDAIQQAEEGVLGKIRLIRTYSIVG